MPETSRQAYLERPVLGELIGRLAVPQTFWLTLAAGIPFTLIYRCRPNLWAVAIAHGILGTLAVYWVAGEDSGAMILQALTGA